MHYCCSLLAADLCKLEAFYMKCLRQLLRVNWWDRVSNDSVLQQAGMTTLSSHLSCRRLSLFGHVARQDSDIPANAALHLMTDLHDGGKKPDESWRRPRGLPRRTWLSHIHEDADFNTEPVDVESCQRPQSGATVNDHAMMMMLFTTHTSTETSTLKCLPLILTLFLSVEYFDGTVLVWRKIPPHLRQKLLE